MLQTPQTELDRAAQAKGILKRLNLPQRLALATPIDEARAQAVANRAKVDRECAFAIIAAARDRVRRSDAERKERQDTDASTASIADYAKKYAQVDAELQNREEDLEEGLRLFFDRHAPKKQTFQAYQSALRARTLARVRDLLKAQDKLQREKASPELWSGTVWLLAWALRDLQAVDGIDRSESLERTGQQPAGSSSKRRLLYKLDPEWRNRFLRVDQRSSTYRMAGVLLRFAGVRPQELQEGIRLRYSDRGIRVLVRGAKVRDTAGQPWRTFLLDVAKLPRWFVDEVRAQKRVVVSADIARHRSHLGRESGPVLNPQHRASRESWRLSAYVFRHALATDLRESGWDTGQIAAVLGEQSAATLRWYGLKNRGTSHAGPVAIIAQSVRVPRAVKPLTEFKPEKIVRTGVKQPTRVSHKN